MSLSDKITLSMEGYVLNPEDAIKEVLNKFGRRK